MARYRILSWREIPTMIKVFSEEGRSKSFELDAWFAGEVDRVAMREGLIGSDANLDQFTWSGDLERPGSPEDVPVEVVAELEAEWLPTRRQA
jgi:hypothetical protein